MTADSKTGRTLSLCLIVKDEQAFLPECLGFAAGVSDEIIVVDTGSTDRTVEIAERHGARVLHYPWNDDFSAARNVSLSAATMDFILVLDADERLAPGSAEVIRELIDAEAEDAPPTLYLPLIENVDAEGRGLGADHMPRLWRRRPELVFTGRIHEVIGVDVPNLRQAYEDRFRIIHLGYDPVIAESKGKRERNLRLLDRELADRPDDPMVVYYLAKERYATGDDEAALEGFRKVVADGTLLNHTLSSYLFGAECLRALGRFREGMQMALDGTRKAPDYGELWFSAGRSALEMGRPAQAEAQFESANQVPQGIAATAFRDRSIAAWHADLLRAQAVLAQRDYARAAHLFDEVRPRLPEAERLGIDFDLVGIWLGLGHANRAWTRLEPLLDAHPEQCGPLLINLFRVYLDTKGLRSAYEIACMCLAAHPKIVYMLPVVDSIARLAEASGDEDVEFEMLQVCVDLESQTVDHYLKLAQRLAVRGELELAREIAQRGRKIASG
jgi:tetratricopeptide (TPR) repeat protein